MSLLSQSFKSHELAVLNEWGVTDQQIRDAIELLDKAGLPIAGRALLVRPRKRWIGTIYGIDIYIDPDLKRDDVVLVSQPLEPARVVVR